MLLHALLVFDSVTSGSRVSTTRAQLENDVLVGGAQRKIALFLPWEGKDRAKIAVSLRARRAARRTLRRSERL